VLFGPPFRQLKYQQEAQLPLRNGVSAMHFGAAVKLLGLAAACTCYCAPCGGLKSTAAQGGG